MILNLLDLASENQSEFTYGETEFYVDFFFFLHFDLLNNMKNYKNNELKLFGRNIKFNF